MPIANALTVAPVVTPAPQQFAGYPQQMQFGQSPGATAFPFHSAPAFAAPSPWGYPPQPAYPQYMAGPQTYVAMVSLWPQPQPPQQMYSPPMYAPPMYTQQQYAPMPQAVPYGYPAMPPAYAPYAYPAAPTQPYPPQPQQHVPPQPQQGPPGF